MKMKKLALEQMEEVIDLSLQGQAPDEAVVDQINRVEEIAETVGALDSIASKLEAAPEGLEPSHGNALAAAVESLCLSAGIERKFAFEEYSTQRGKQRQTQIVLEGIRETIDQLIKKIVAMVQKFFQWLKQVLTFRKAQTQAVRARCEKAQHVVAEVKAKKQAVPEATLKSEVNKNLPIHKPHIFRVLKKGTRGVEPTKLLDDLKHHNKMMLDAFHVFGENNAAVALSTDRALGAINNDEFQRYLMEALTDAASLPVQMPKSSDQNRFGELSPGVAVYEEELLFGEKSIFRTAASGAGDLMVSDIHFAVMSSTKSKNVQSNGEGLPSLSATLIEEIIRTQRDHVEHVLVPALVKNEEMLEEIKRIETHLTALRNRGDDADRKKAGRIGLLMQLLAMLQRLIGTTDVGLANYDKSVQTAVSEYAVASCEFAYA